MQLRKALAIISTIVIGVSCTGQAKPKFADVASLLCEGLEEFTDLHNDILSVHLLIEQGNYADALKVAYALLETLDESKDIKGLKELRALVFLLEGIVKGPV